jgi:hypothetical protein
MSHGIHGDFEEATTTYPKDANGVDMTLAQAFCQDDKEMCQTVERYSQSTRSRQGKVAAKIASNKTTTMVASSATTKTDVVYSSFVGPVKNLCLLTYVDVDIGPLPKQQTSI